MTVMSSGGNRGFEDWEIWAYVIGVSFWARAFGGSDTSSVLVKVTFGTGQIVGWVIAHHLCS